MRAFALLTIAVLAAIGTSAQSSTKPMARPAHGTYSPGAPIPPSVIPLDLAFASPTRGYEVVQEGSGLYVGTTTDGGKSWSVVSRAPLSAPARRPSLSGPERVESFSTTS